MKQFTQKEPSDDLLFKTSKKLYGWFLLLYYFWMLINDKNVNFHEMDGTIEIDEFSIPVSQKWYNGVKKLANKDFEKIVIEFLKKQPSDRKPFFKDLFKEFALSFWLTSNPRKIIPIEEKDSFARSSMEHRCLSIIYENFHSFKDVISRESEINFLHALDNFKEAVARDASQLIGYWMVKDGRIRASRKGGKRPTRKQGIVLAIEKVLEIFKEKGYQLSREKLWRYLENHHDINESQEPIEIGNYTIFFSEGRLCQESQFDNKIKVESIGKETFFKYVTALRKKVGT